MAASVMSMFSKRDEAHRIFRPNAMTPDHRRFTGGKNMDGTYWIEIEGQGRVTMLPAQAFQMAVGLLRAMGIDLPPMTPPQ